MGRFETLNDETKDLVTCLIPALASAFKVKNAVDIIPEDIRMRMWDCERRDHIKNKTENDPRNWGVQFIKDLMAIARLTDGDLETFQADLREKVDLHEPKHPWARLADIREIKLDYENPGRKNAVPVHESSSEEEVMDPYFEELVEPDLPRGLKRGRHEMYEARVALPRKRKAGRLRRTESGGFMRTETPSKKRLEVRVSPKDAPLRNRRPSRAVHSDSEESFDPQSESDAPRRHISTLSRSPYPRGADHDDPTITRVDEGRGGYNVPDTSSRSPGPHGYYPALSSSGSPGAHGGILFDPKSVDHSSVPLEVQMIEAELEVAEAELRAARMKWAYIEAKKQGHGQAGTETPPQGRQ